MIYNVLEQDPGREFILAADRGPSYRGVADAMKGETNKKVCEPTEAFEQSFRAWKVDPDPQFLIRVTHSSGMLEGKYTLETKFDADDHRSHRPRAWLVEGVQKVERLEPLCEKRGVTIGQLALLWLYAHPSIVSALPNIYNEEQLEEFAGASKHAPLDDAEMEEIHQMYIRHFDVVPYAEEAVAVR
jgi:aryl-alcohol dehydrogenase-like predicted oxidoreductase